MMALRVHPPQAPIFASVRLTNVMRVRYHPRWTTTKALVEAKVEMYRTRGIDLMPILEEVLS